MGSKKEKAIRRTIKKNKNKIIAEFVTDEKNEILNLYVIEKIQKMKIMNRIKIAVAIIRGYHDK